MKPGVATSITPDPLLLSKEYLDQTNTSITENSRIIEQAKHTISIKDEQLTELNMDLKPQLKETFGVASI